VSLPGPARLRFPGAPAPRPLLPPEAERRLTARQREVLGALEALVVRGGFAGLTMAGIAARLECSLSTLYGIAPSKDELVLAVVDRRLRGIGRRALAAVDASKPALDALRAYLRTVNEALQPATHALARELADVPGAQRLLDAHEGYVVAVTRGLLARAIEEGEIPPVDAGALAHVLGGLGRELSRPEVAESALAGTPKQAADAITEIVLRGLERGPPPRRRPARPRR
jgi:AcrR family transcriptional regulator